MAEAVNIRRMDEKRFVDVSSEPNKILPPLPQTSESEAIPTLLDAIKSSEHLVENLQEKVKKALDKCKNSKGKLTHDQAAALYLYSMQWPKGKDSFFFLFNRALRSEDRTRLVPYHNYFNLFMSALNKLPSIEQQVWRGVDGDLTDRYLPGTVHVWWGASSCTDQVHVTGTFLDQTVKRTLFNIKCYEGKVIKDYSEFPNESETILPPGTYLKVMSSLLLSSDVYIVELKQIPPNPKLLSQTLLIASGASKKKDGDLYLIWSDSSVNDSSENKDMQEKLREIFNNLKPFESEDQCEKFIKQNENKRFVLIVNGQIGRDLVPKIHNLSQVISIYVYCMDKKGNEMWAKNYDKVKAVIVQSADLIAEIEKEKNEQQSSQDWLGDFSSQLTIDSNQSNDVLCSPQSAIRGYEKIPLQPLQQALQPLNDFIPDLDQFVQIALKYNKGDNGDGLSADESAAIYIYTIESSEGEHSLYRLLNQDLRSKDRQRLKKWFPYLRLFMNALNKLPSQRCTVWRGVQGDLSALYQKGNRGAWLGLSSTTPNGSTLESDMYLGKTGTRTLFTIDSKNGKSIKDYSYFSNEEEILLMPGFCYEVTDIMKPAPGLHIIHLKEIDPFV